jgi:two-component system, OmpR family, sensor histidine kinase KdpD
VRGLLTSRLPGFVVALGTVVAITAVCYKLIHVNATTVALTFILAILIVSTIWDLSVSLTMSVAAMLAYNYYFLPPVLTLTIADPQNWVALAAFLITAVIGSDLSSRAQRQADEADRRRREIEKLYQFSQRLLSSGNAIELQNAIPSQVVDSFELGAAALFLADKQKVYMSGKLIPQLDRERLQAVAAREELQVDEAQSLCFVPVRLGVRAIGSLGVSGRILSRQSLEAMGTLIAVAIERARAVEQLGKTEAAREGERLKSALLDSITHDFRTPLTSIKASVTSLLTDAVQERAPRRELLTIIDEETNRLNSLVGEAAEMARLEAGEFELDVQPQDIRAIVDAALEQCKTVLNGRPVQINIAENTPQVKADLDRAKQVLVQLVTNANNYSAQGLPITISAEPHGDCVTTSVADRGRGIDDAEIGLIFDKFYRGREQRYVVQGTGMGLPIAKAIVEALGGTISVVSQLGQGSVFSFTLPIYREQAARA